MSKEDVKEYIHSEKRNAHSTGEQVQIAHAMWENNIGPRHDGIKRSEVEETLGLSLDHKPKTSLKHLVEIDLVKEFKNPGPDTFVIATWREEDAIINGGVPEAAEEGIESLIRHIHRDDTPGPDDTSVVADGGKTVRSIVAAQFDYDPESIEDYLRTGDPVDKLNRSVEAIEEADHLETTDDYGEVRFINAAYRYRLTSKAVNKYEVN
jgi:hypothetical protein